MITTFIGPMFAGKTSEMVNVVERHHIAKKKCVIVKYAKDTRYDHLAVSGGIITHRGDEKYKVPVIRVDKLSDCNFDFVPDVIGVDEAQFYPDAIEVIQNWANSGKKVICASLDADSNGNPFGCTARLVAISENVVKLKAVCMLCTADASFSKRIVSSDQLVDIGGADKYVAACRKCMF